MEEAVRRIVIIILLIIIVTSGIFWIGIVLSAAFRPCSRKISRWLTIRRKRQTQSAAHEPVIQAQNSLQQCVDEEMGMRNTTENTPVNPEPGGELGEFVTFASRFGMQWISSSRVTRCWKFSFPWFLVLFLFLWTAYVVQIILQSRLDEVMCADRDVTECPAFRSQIFQSAWPYITSIGNPLILWFVWKRRTNPVAEALVHMQSVTPDLHIQCCKFAKRAFACFIVLSCLLSVVSFLLVIVAGVGGFLVSTPTLLPTLLLPSHVMVATFAFVFYIMRHRLRAFLSLVRYAHSSGQPVDNPDIPLLLKILNCPIALVCEWTSISQNGSTDDCLKWLRLQLHRLWMTQIRQANTLVQRNSVWLGFQALVVLGQLIGFLMSKFAFPPSFIRRSSEARTPSGTLQTVLDINSILSNILIFELALGPIAALFFLALTRWQIDRACLQIEAALETTSSVLDASADTTLQKDVCNGEDSLGSLLAFCRASSVNTLQVFGLPMNFASLMQYFYLTGLTFGLVAAYVSASR